MVFFLSKKIDNFTLIKHLIRVLFVAILSAIATPESIEARTRHEALPHASEGGARLVEVRKIWDKGAHNAFTDMVRFRERWFVAFREAPGHLVSPDGAIRLIVSNDGAAWESAALIRSDHADLRDPKIDVTPDGRLMLSAAGALNKPAPHTHQSYVWFSEDGYTWGDAIEVGDSNYWLWRVTWRKGVAYGIGYECGGVGDTRLYRSDDGRRFETLVAPFHNDGSPNESAMVFLPDDTAVVLLRREGPNGLLGVAKPPYTKWEWKDTGARIGGPEMTRLPNGRLVAAVRLYDGETRTSLCWVDLDTGRLREFLRLPSGGDTSYPGLVWNEGLLWVSYYASHEEKTSIYLAKVKISELKR